MKMINKEELKYVGGYVVHPATGDVVNDPRLVYEYNELMEMKDFNAFLKENKKAIKASDTQVVYKIPAREQAVKVAKPETPFTDKREEEALAFWNEKEEVSAVRQTNDLLARYDRLATFVTEDQVLLTGEITAKKFMGNVLKFTKKDIIKIVKDYVGLTELRVKVIVR